MAWLQVNVLHQLQLRAWQGRLPTESAHMQHENFFKKKKTNCRELFWDTRGGPWSCPGREKSHQKLVAQETIKNHVFQVVRFWISLLVIEGSRCTIDHNRVLT